jgi:glycosyltransferase involved in cell wall biosynthesis
MRNAVAILGWGKGEKSILQDGSIKAFQVVVFLLVGQLKDIGFEREVLVIKPRGTRYMGLERKKVLAISNHHCMLGGGEHSFINLVCNMPSSWQILAVVPGKGEVLNRLRLEGIESYVIPTVPLRLQSIADVVSDLKCYYKIAVEKDVALIYANGTRAAVYGCIVGKLLRIPCIWHCRTAESDPVGDRLLSAVCRVIVANSKATSKRFQGRLGEKVKIAYNGINLDWLRDKQVAKPPTVGSDWRVILVVARVSKWKRHDLALSAFEQVAPRHADLRLVCIGAVDGSETDWWQYLQKRTKASKFRERIHWIGQIDDVRPWYRVATILLLPSDNEPFGRVLVEAMACGVPIVATAGGGVPEVVRNGREGILVQTGSAYEMANAVRRLLDDANKMTEIGRAGEERAKDFSLDKHIRGIEAIFEEAIRLHK